MRVLIGNTGYVGSTLLQQQPFDASYNSRNIDDLRGQAVDEIWCAGVSAAKWIANKDPAGDKLKIGRLESILDTVQCKSFVLISTIDVYPNPVAVDEHTPIDATTNHAYGANRLAFENFVQRRFSNALTIRLPALFGNGLRKNIVFDLLNRNGLEAINRETAFQWYDMSCLTTDASIVRKQSIDLINFAMEPIGTSEILERFFPEIEIAAPSKPGPRYDFRSIHAESLFGKPHYFRTRSQVLEQLGRFVQAEKERLACT